MSADWTITRKAVPVDGEAQIADVVRARIAADFASTVERYMVDAIMTSNVAPAEPAKPLTVKSLAQSMAEATFDADIIISDYVPKEMKNSDDKLEPVDAFRIDNTALPSWDIKQAIAAARGEPPPKKVTLVFPSAEKAMEAVALATKSK